MKKYIYEGPVTSFNKIIDDNWTAETMAVTAKKAKSNLIYQFKKQKGYEPAAKIELPGKIMLVN